MRVVSLLPSATEIICLLGADDLLVGRSHECDHPAQVRDLPVLTAAVTPFVSSADTDRSVRLAVESGCDLYRLDKARLQILRPDLILTQGVGGVCDVCSVRLDAVIAAAGAMDPAPMVLSLNPTTFEGVLDDVLSVGEAVGKPDEAQRAVTQMRERFFAATNHVNPFDPGPSLLFIEWTDPVYVGGHWTAQLIERAGASHPLNPTVPMEGAGAGAGGQMAHRAAPPSRRVSVEEIVASAPDAIVVCPCGLDIQQTRIELELLTRQGWWNELPAVRGANQRVALVDGNQMFNRPGPRLVDAYRWLVGWLHGLPDLIPDDFPWEPL